MNASMSETQRERLRDLERAAADAAAAVRRARTIVFVEQCKFGRWCILRADVGSPEDRLYVGHRRTKSAADSAAFEFAKLRGFTYIEEVA